MRSIIPLMNLLQEMKDFGFDIGNTQPKIHCRVFEDNSGALELAKSPRMRPRTKYINIKYHHFRSYVADGSITIHKIDTADQVADYLTKALSPTLLQKHRLKVQGW